MTSIGVGVSARVRVRVSARVRVRVRVRVTGEDHAEDAERDKLLAPESTGVVPMIATVLGLNVLLGVDLRRKLGEECVCDQAHHHKHENVALRIIVAADARDRRA